MYDKRREQLRRHMEALRKRWTATRGDTTFSQRAPRRNSPRVYAERYQHSKRRLGRQRGPKVAQIDLSRKLTEAIWHMLTRNQPFAPTDARFRLAA